MAFSSIAADIIVILHFLWIVFLIFGAFPGRRHTWVRIIHIGGLFSALLIQIFGWYCPLTHLETWLRGLHDPADNYSGSFIIYYIEELVYIGISPKIIFILTVLIVLMSLWIYLHTSDGQKSDVSNDS